MATDEAALVCHSDREACKNGITHRDAVWMLNHVLHWVTLAPPGEYDQTARERRRRCGLMSN